jgi:hypothetical protein
MSTESTKSATAASFQETVRKFQAGMPAGSAKPQQTTVNKLSAHRSAALNAVFTKGALPTQVDGREGSSPTSPP